MRADAFRLSDELLKLSEYNRRLMLITQPSERKRVIGLKCRSAERARYLASQMALSANISRYQLKALEGRISHLEKANPQPVKLMGRGELLDKWARMVKRRK